MSTFAFRAVDVTGIPSRGEVEAPSKGQVTEQLRSKGLIVLDVTEKKQAMQIEMPFKKKKIDLRELTIFSRQFATLIASGMPMLRSLTTLEAQTADPKISEATV